VRRRVNPDEALSRERIADAALAVLSEHGLDGLTVRKVAARLGVQHGALYWHVRHKQDLLDEAAQALLMREFAELSGPQTTDDWREWLAETARRLRKAMLSHRDGAAIVATSRSKSRVDMISAIGEAVQQVLAEAGFSAEEAFAVQVGVLGYAMGVTAQEQATVERAMPPANAERFPRLARAKDAAAGILGEPDGPFEAGLAVLLDGAAQRRSKVK